MSDEYLNRGVLRIYGRIQTWAGSIFRNQSAGSGAWIDIVIGSQPESNLSSLSPCIKFKIGRARTNPSARIAVKPI